MAGAVAARGAVSVGVGGRGAAGGAAAAVAVTSEAAIATRGNRSPGVSAQSVGGGGGHGGFDVTVSGLATWRSIGVAVGGDGGRGGAAFAVTVQQPARSITTQRPGVSGHQRPEHRRRAAETAASPWMPARAAGADRRRCRRGRRLGRRGGARSTWTTGRDHHGRTRLSGIFAQSISDGGGSGDFSFAGGLSSAEGAGRIGVRRGQPGGRRARRRRQRWTNHGELRRAAATSPPASSRRASAAAAAARGSASPAAWPGVALGALDGLRRRQRRCRWHGAAACRWSTRRGSQRHAPAAASRRHERHRATRSRRGVRHLRAERRRRRRRGRRGPALRAGLGQRTAVESQRQRVGRRIGRQRRHAAARSTSRTAARSRPRPAGSHAIYGAERRRRRRQPGA